MPPANGLTTNCNVDLAPQVPSHGARAIAMIRAARPFRSAAGTQQNLALPTPLHHLGGAIPPPVFRGLFFGVSILKRWIGRPGARPDCVCVRD